MHGLKVSVRCDIPSDHSIDVEMEAFFSLTLSSPALFIPLYFTSLGMRIAKSIELNGVATEAIECPY